LKPRYSGLLGCLVLLSACAVGTDYTPPKNEISDSWYALDASQTDQYGMADTVAASGVKVTKSGRLPAGPWWEQFDDELLSELMEQALIDNNDLKVAQARIAEARADEDYALGQLLPQINVSGSISRSSLDSLNSNRGDTVRQAGISGDWDIDPFGGNRRLREASLANAEASEEGFAQVRLSLLAEVAHNYSRLRAAQKQHELTLRNLKIQNTTLNNTRELRKAQQVTELDIARVEAQVANTQARLPQIRTDIYASINRLSVLIGKEPFTLYDLLMPPKPMFPMPKDLMVLPPIATIAQRPDVRIAERRLAQTSALSNAAFAEFFPKLSLSAFFGKRRSDTFGNLSPWSATAEALFPLLDFGRIQAQVNSADARQEQAFYAYKQTVLLALEDTENSLNAYMNERQRSTLLRKVAQEQSRAVTIASEQYRGGIVTQLDLLDAQRNQLEAESNWVLSQQAATDDLIGLYRALGQGPANNEPMPQ
jgi:NodT family efflux transporter outer membrane factor (OMF) lipoprotein